MAANPYNKINPLSFLLRKVGTVNDRSRYFIESTEHTAFDMCTFRRHLVDWLMETMQGQWQLRNHGNDYLLELGTGWDETMLRDQFRAI